ncbi:UNVERIFIED_CONTAM: polyprotein [Sesamum latifolium]|uniref:Polyprotein n=1 Tax=Sesamum latifolium TaxID=2727402 RepID=A0AAW2XSV7_9LAMI
MYRRRADGGGGASTITGGGTLVDPLEFEAARVSCSAAAGETGESATKRAKTLGDGSGSTSEEDGGKSGSASGIGVGDKESIDGEGRTRLAGRKVVRIGLYGVRMQEETGPNPTVDHGGFGHQTVQPSISSIRKGLPVTARIALLNTRFLEYEHAVIGTVLTTLNAGSIVVTFFPDFVVSLCDPHVASTFKVQQQHETIKATDFRFKRLPDGRVKTIFETQRTGEPSNPEFQLMITPILVPEEIITPINSFGADGHRIYTDWINGHFIWDVDPSMCDPECSCGEESDDDDDDYVWSDYESDEDDDFSSCNDSDDDYDEPDPDDRPSFRTPHPCMMFQYDTDFPPMERYVDSAQKYSSKPYVQNNVVDTEGKLKPLTQAEEVLNWQTTNARAQNRSLTTLDAKMDRVLAKPLFTTQPLFGESPPPSPPDFSKYFFMASSIPTDLPKAPPKQSRKKYTPEEKQKTPETSTPPVAQQHVSHTLMATQPKPKTYPITPEPFVTPSTESYEIPSEPEPPETTHLSAFVMRRMKIPIVHPQRIMIPTQKEARILMLTLQTLHLS